MQPLALFVKYTIAKALDTMRTKWSKRSRAPAGAGAQTPVLRGWRLVEKAGKGPSPERSGDAIGILIGKLDPHALAVMAHQFPCEADNMPANPPSRARARADRHCLGLGLTRVVKTRGMCWLRHSDAQGL